MKLVQEVNYTYDAFNQLISRSVDTDGDTGSAYTVDSFYYWENGQIVLEFDDDVAYEHGTLNMSDLGHRYLWGPAVDQLLADENATTNVITWPLPDHLGTIRDWVNNSGTNLDHAEYDTSGRRLDTAAIDEVFGFQGLLHDKYTGNNFNRARWTEPDTGQFLSEDPFRDGTNWHIGYGNAATVNTDPQGLQTAVVTPPSEPPVIRPLPLPSTSGSPSSGAAPPMPGVSPAAPSTTMLPFMGITLQTMLANTLSNYENILDREFKHAVQLGIITEPERMAATKELLLYFQKEHAAGNIFGCDWTAVDTNFTGFAGDVIRGLQMRRGQSGSAPPGNNTGTKTGEDDDGEYIDLWTGGMTAAEKAAIIEYAKRTNAWIAGQGGSVIGKPTAGLAQREAKRC